MPSCEKCWTDSRGDDVDGDGYSRLLERRKDSPCAPEQQAGEFAEDCPACSRRTVHQYAKVCMVCGEEPALSARAGSGEK